MGCLTYGCSENQYTLDAICQRMITYYIVLKIIKAAYCCNFETTDFSFPGRKRGTEILTHGLKAYQTCSRRFIFSKCIVHSIHVTSSNFISFPRYEVDDIIVRLNNLKNDTREKTLRFRITLICFSSVAEPLRKLMNQSEMIMRQSNHHHEPIDKEHLICFMGNYQKYLTHKK